jgi:hypothetical protein
VKKFLQENGKIAREIETEMRKKLGLPTLEAASGSRPAELEGKKGTPAPVPAKPEPPKKK